MKTVWPIQSNPFHSLVQVLKSRPNWQRFFRGEGPFNPPVKIVNRNIFILPTRQGVFFATVLLVMLIGSINYNNSLGYGLTFLLTSMIIISIFYTYRNLLGLTVDTHHIPSVFAGDSLKVPVVIVNPQHSNTASRLSGSINNNERYNIGIHFENQSLSEFNANQEWNKVDVVLQANKRGQHLLPKLTLNTGFPFSLFKAWSYINLNTQYLVYPKPINVLIFPSNVAYQAKDLGDQGRGSDDFVGLRNYHPGDSLRHINWKTLAHHQELVIKQFGGDRNNELWLEWQTLDHMQNIEDKLSQLSAWILKAESMQLNYGLRLPGKEIEPSNGKLHQQLCLKSLALFEV